ncbi:MAG TPA: hypothetical protein V6C63_18500 [Allocoleopsis sp.]
MIRPIVDFEKKRRQANLHFVNRARSLFKKIRLPFQVVPSYIPDPPSSFFTGCWLLEGCLYFCPARVQVGELLHEAGHLALLPKDVWPSLQPGQIEIQTFGLESGDYAVEAWDYAAAIECDIPSLAVFDKGFNDAGWTVWELFDAGIHPGIKMLQDAGMTQNFPVMKRWFA